MIVKKRDGDIYIDLLAIIMFLWKNALVILLTATAFCAATFGYLVFLVPQKYEAEASMYVNNSSFSLQREAFSILESEMSASSTLSRTYIYILETRETIEKVIEEAGLDYTYEEIMSKMKMLTSEEITGTAIFKVIITSESPTEAELIANTIVKVLPSRIEEIVDGTDVRTVSFAIVPSHRASPNYLVFSALGFAVGAAAAVVWVSVREILERKNIVTIGSEADLRKRYPDIPVLSIIPDMRLVRKKDYYYSKGKAEAAFYGQ